MNEFTQRYDLVLMWHDVMLDGPLTGYSTFLPAVKTFFDKLSRWPGKRPSVGILVHEPRVGMRSWQDEYSATAVGSNLPDSQQVKMWGECLRLQVPFPLHASIYYCWVYKKHGTNLFASVPITEAGDPEWGRLRRPPWPGLVRAAMRDAYVYDGRRVLVVGDGVAQRSAAMRAGVDWSPADRFFVTPVAQKSLKFA